MGMPEYGILIKRDDGAILVDPYHAHVVPSASWEFQLPAWSAPSTPLFLTLLLVETAPVVVVMSLEEGYLAPPGLEKVQPNMPYAYSSVITAVTKDQTATTGKARVQLFTYDFFLETSSHGIQVFDPFGQKVFSSSKRILQVLAAGTETIAYNGSALINIPPTSKRPYFHISCADFMKFVPDGVGGYDLYVPVLGPVEQDGNGDYYRFEIAGKSIVHQPGFLNIGPSTFDVNWVAFVF